MFRYRRETFTGQIVVLKENTKYQVIGKFAGATLFTLGKLVDAVLKKFCWQGFPFLGNPSICAEVYSSSVLNYKKYFENWKIQL